MWLQSKIICSIESRKTDGWNRFVKNSPYMKEWMADPPKEASMVKKWMAGRYSFLQIK